MRRLLVYQHKGVLLATLAKTIEPFNDYRLRIKEKEVVLDGTASFVFCSLFNNLAPQVAGDITDVEPAPQLFTMPKALLIAALELFTMPKVKSQ